MPIAHRAHRARHAAGAGLRIGAGWLAGLVLAAFALTAAALAGEAPTTQRTSCLGTDLVARMQAEDPAAYRAYEAEAKTIANVDGLLWRIEKPGAAPSYLFGTMHASDERLIRIAGRTRDYVAAARVVATELGDMGVFTRTLIAAKAAYRGLRREGDTLAVIDVAAQRASVEALLATRNVDAEKASHIEPWLLVALLAAPVCELERQKAGSIVVDEKVTQMADEAGVPVEALETIDEQLDVITALAPDEAARMLVSMAARPDLLDDSFETMIGLYEAGRAGVVLLATVAAAKLSPEDAALNAAFMARLVGRRNLVMRDRAMPLIDAGGAFIAVGALHLPGDDGLVALFRAQGYELTKIW